MRKNPEIHQEQIKTTIKNMVQFTYLMYDGRYYKIGKSKHPENRLKDLKVANPLLSLIVYGEGCTEKYLHNLFKSRRIKGEFYDFHDNELIAVTGLIKKGETNKTFVFKNADIFNRLFKKARDYIFPFGMYKGRRLVSFKTEREFNYLNWLIKISSGERNDHKKNFANMLRYYINNYIQFDDCDRSDTLYLDVLLKREDKQNAFINETYRPAIFSLPIT